MYFKILTEDLTHHGYTYKKGLNVDPKPFNPEPKWDNGLFFADEKNILGFCGFGNKIAEVIVPDGERIIRVGDEYKAHRIILREIRNLWNVETFEWLKNCGVDLHKDNDIALYGAVELNHVEIAKYLLEHDANIDALGGLALKWAAKNGYIEIVKCLIERGADVHSYNDSAFWLAAWNNHFEVMKYLAENKANIHAQEDFALRWAVVNGLTEMAKYLVEHGADIHIMNDLPLRFAAEKGYQEIVKYLIEKGANVCVLDDHKLQFVSNINMRLAIIPLLEIQPAIKCLKKSRFYGFFNCQLFHQRLRRFIKKTQQSWVLYYGFVSTLMGNSV